MRRRQLPLKMKLAHGFRGPVNVCYRHETVGWRISLNCSCDVYYNTDQMRACWKSILKTVKFILSAALLIVVGTCSYSNMSSVKGKADTGKKFFASKALYFFFGFQWVLISTTSLPLFLPSPTSSLHWYRWSAVQQSRNKKKKSSFSAVYNWNRTVILQAQS
jgi:hypothetical protein